MISFLYWFVTRRLMVPRIFVSFCAGKNCLMGVQNCHVCSVSSVSVTRAKAMCHYACGDSCEKDYIRHLSTKIDVHPSMFQYSIAHQKDCVLATVS